MSDKSAQLFKKLETIGVKYERVLAAAILAELNVHNDLMGYFNNNEVLIYTRWFKEALDSPLREVIIHFNPDVPHRVIKTIDELVETSRKHGPLRFVEQLLETVYVTNAEEANSNSDIGQTLTHLYRVAKDLTFTEYPAFQREIRYSDPKANLVPGPASKGNGIIEAHNHEVDADLHDEVTGWLKDGKYTNSKGEVEELTGDLNSASAEALIAAVIFSAVSALSLGKNKLALGLLSSIPGQVGKMMLHLAEQCVDQQQEKSASKLSSEWQSTLENIDKIYPADKQALQNKIAHVVGGMAAVKAGMYPPLTALVHALSENLKQEKPSKAVKRPVKKVINEDQL